MRRATVVGWLVGILATVGLVTAGGASAASRAGASSRAGTSVTPAAATTYTPPPIKHVFIIVDENESASVTFGADSPAPYLSKTLVSKGAYLPDYYGVGHSSLDNYIAMVSAQAPNTMTSADCGTFANFASPSMTDGQENGVGCVYPADVPTIMSQLDGAALTWGAYEDSMGGSGGADATDEARDSTAGTPPTCGHPVVGTADGTQTETATDQYATRHDPFVYFHYVIDDQPRCDADVVNLSELPKALSSEASTRNYTFITPGLCDDGHNTNCANGDPGGLPQADSFLQTWVPQIMASAAYKDNGLIMIIFDEALPSDASACCGEMPGPGELEPGGTGPGGGDTGAVLLSRFIKPGTTSMVPYNHYSMLASVEDLFGLPRIGYAAGTAAFGSDVFTNWVAPADSSLKLSRASFVPHANATTITYRDAAAAVSTLVFASLKPGYVRAHGCTALTPGRARPTHSASCTATSTVLTTPHRDSAGTNRISFSGRGLAAGRYRLTVTPSLQGVTGTPLITSFTVR